MYIHQYFNLSHCQNTMTLTLDSEQLFLEQNYGHYADPIPLGFSMDYNQMKMVEGGGILTTLLGVGKSLLPVLKPLLFMLLPSLLSKGQRKIKEAIPEDIRKTIMDAVREVKEQSDLQAELADLRRRLEQGTSMPPGEKEGGFARRSKKKIGRVLKPMNLKFV